MTGWTEVCVGMGVEVGVEVGGGGDGGSRNAQI